MNSQALVDRPNGLSTRSRDVFSGKSRGIFTDQSNGCVKKGGQKLPRNNSFGNARIAPLYGSSSTSSNMFQIYEDNDTADEVISMEIEDEDDFFRVPNQTQQEQEIAQHKQTIQDLQNLLKTQREQIKLLYSERQKYKNECQRLVAHIKNKDTSRKKQAVTLSPLVFSVKKDHSIVRSRLARSASIRTAARLNEVELQEDAKNQYAQEVTKRISSHTRNKAYLKSQTFATHLSELCYLAASIFRKESRLLELESPCYVFGDLHGNLRDLNFFRDNVWTMGMELTAGKFLCLGDYVDRGQYSLEVVAYMFAQKVMYPNKVFLLRGNHETRGVNGWKEHYKSGCFLTQCIERFKDCGREGVGQFLWEKVNKVFDYMPLAAVIDSSIFCVHGGIPRPRAGFGMHQMLTAVQKIPVPLGISPCYEDEQDTDGNHFAMDLVWGDPASGAQEHALDKYGFAVSGRGGDVANFGSKAINDFLSKNGLSYIIRAHEATASGIKLSKGAKVFTVFSTSKDHNCGKDATCGCILVDDGKILSINRAMESEKQTDSTDSSMHPSPAKRSK